MSVYPTADTDSLNLENKRFIDIAKKITAAVNKNVSGGIGLKISFNGNTKLVEPYDVVDGYFLKTEVLCDLINQVFHFEIEGNYEDKDDYLILLLKVIKNGIADDVDIGKTVKEIFKNLYIKDLFEDDISAKFFRDKLNSYLQNI